MFNVESFDFFNYYELSEKDKLKVLSWRNNENVRKWMTNKAEIKKEDHLNFVEQLKKSETKKYFLVNYKNNSVGSVYLDYKNGKHFWGYFLDPSIINSGMGFFLEFAALKFFFSILKLDEVYAEILPENVNTLKVQNFFGFKKINETTYMIKRNEYKFISFDLTMLKKELIKGIKV